MASYGVMNTHVILGNHKQFIWLKHKYVGEKGWKLRPVKQMGLKLRSTDWMLLAVGVIRGF